MIIYKIKKSFDLRKKICRVKPDLNCQEVSLSEMNLHVPHMMCVQIHVHEPTILAKNKSRDYS